jgi:hypothetical protein
MAQSSPSRSHTSSHDLAKERELELKRERKWTAMLEEPRRYFKKDRAKMESRILKGIPNSVRSRAWQYIIDPKSITPRRRATVAELMAGGRASAASVRQIELDIPRTFGDFPKFTNDLRQQLRCVLIAHANLDRELGYTQGMSAIAAPLVIYMDVDSAFWCFNSLMRKKRYAFRDIYLSGFPKLEKIKIVWLHFLKKKCKRVAKYLEENSILFENYGMSWFMTAFMSQQFEEELRMRIFDRYAGFGTRALLSFGLLIVKRLKKKIIKGDMENAMTLMRDPGIQEEFAECKKVCDKWNELWLSEGAYAKLFKDVKEDVFP